MTPLEHAEAMEQTADVIRRCADGQPNGFKLQSCQRNSKALDWCDTKGDGNGASTGFTDRCVMYYRLVEIPKPVMVPLDASDVIVGKTIFSGYSDGRSPVAAIGRADNQPGVWLAVAGCVNSYKFSTLQNENWFYSNDHGKTWAKAEKPAP